MAEQQQEQKPEIVTRDQVYIGDRFNSKDKVAQFWMELDEQGKVTGNSFSYTVFKQKGAVPGCVYRFTGVIQPDGSFNFWTKGFNQPYYLKPYPDREQVVAWELEHRKINTIKAARAKAAKQELELAKLLKPIKDAYHNTNFEGRSALLAIVIQEVMKP